MSPLPNALLRPSSCPVTCPLLTCTSGRQALLYLKAWISQPQYVGERWVRPPSSLVAGGDDCCHVSLDAFVFLNVCLPRAILRCGAVRLNVGSIVPRGRIKTISSHKNESIVVPMGCISRPRLKHNPNDGLFCAYAYPAPYPEDTRRIPGSATRRFFNRGRD